MIGLGFVHVGGSMTVTIEKRVSTDALARLGSIRASAGWTARRTRSYWFIISGKMERADVR
jgi:hypothetical protein